MFIDNELRFATAFSPTSQTTGVVFTNTLDTSPLGLPSGSGGGSGTNAGRDLGVGGEMWLRILVTASATSSGASTEVFGLATDSTSALSTVNKLVQSPSYAYTVLVAGFEIKLQLPAVAPGASNPYLRYIGVFVAITTADLSAGTFEAELVKNIQTGDLYTSGFTIA